MTSVDSPLIILENPYIFVNEEYLKTNLLTGKYSNGKVIEIL